ELPRLSAASDLSADSPHLVGTTVAIDVGAGFMPARFAKRQVYYGLCCALSRLPFGRPARPRPAEAGTSRRKPAGCTSRVRDWALHLVSPPWRGGPVRLSREQILRHFAEPLLL